MNPACTGLGSRASYVRQRKASGADRGVLSRILANQKNANRQRKVTRAVANAILASSEGQAALAARHGLGRATVSRVRRGLGKVPGNLFGALQR